MDERIKFWSDESRWPRDAQGYTFICRAVHAVGRTIYGNDWTNAEPNVVLIQKLPLLQSFLKDWQLIEVYNKLRFSRPDLLLPILKHNTYFLPKPEFTNEMWSAAVTLYDELNSKTEPSVAKFNAAKLQLFEALANGQVVSCLRPKPGGDFSLPCPTSWWNTERWENRFYWGQLNPKDPFGNYVGGDHFQWVFIEAKSLQTFLDSLKDVGQSTSGTIAGEKRCEAWLIAIMSESPNRRTQPKTVLLEEAKKKFGVSGRGFERSWSSAIRATDANWNKAGRTKPIA